MGRAYKRKTKKLDGEAIKKAVEGVNDKMFSIREAARIYKVPKSTLSRVISQKQTKSSGGQLSIPLESELELVECIKIKSRWGFAESVEEIKCTVKQFVDVNINEDTEVGLYLKSYCKFNNNAPGKDWMTAFMRRHNLSVKCPSTLEKARKTAASDPNIIYGYYDSIESEMKRLKIKDRPECIWNIDETSLFIDPRNIKVVAPKGVKASRTTATSGREATSIMAGISAAGECLAPLIIFKGKNIQSTWRGLHSYPNTQYAVSENGWMMSDIFISWFDLFCKQQTQRPLLLVYDGHSTHLTSSIIKKARSENITIIKLPPHTTDRLQPLDVCCFKPLKIQWDKAIAKFQQTNNARRITKSEFVDLVGQVWSSAFTEKNILKSFEKTGMYPVNRTRYPEIAFKPNLLSVYKDLKHLTEPPEAKPKPATPNKSVRPSSSSSVSPVLISQPSTSTPVSNSKLNLSTSFEQIMADKACYKQPLDIHNTDAASTSSMVPKRRKINPSSRVITDDEFLKEIIDTEEKHKKKNTVKLEFKIKKMNKDSAHKEKEKEIKEFSNGVNEIEYNNDSSSDSEYEECNDTTTEAKFNKECFRNIKPVFQGVYVVDYDKKFYIGRCIKLGKTKIKMNYFIRRPNDKYDLPIHSDTDDIEAKYLICGPLKLIGTVPFTIHGADKAFVEYQKAKRGT